MRNRKLIGTGAAALLLALASSVAAQQPSSNQRAEAERRAAQLEEQRQAREQAEEDRRQAREDAEEQRRQAFEEAEEQRQQAQQEAEDQRQHAQRDAEQRRELAQKQREQRADVERDLSSARRELEEAAREVARLSSQLAAPIVDGIARNFRYWGQRAMLGVGIEDTERGVRIASVTPNGPAANAGLSIGDTITAIEGAELADPRVTGGGKQSPSELLVAQMANVDPGESVELRVLAENGAERNVSVTLGELSPWSPKNAPRVPAVPKAPSSGYSYNYNFGPGPGWFFRSSPWSSMQLVTLTPELGAYFGTAKGLLVVRAPEDRALSLRDGDVILDIGGREPTTPEHALRILGSFAEGEPLAITVMRDRRRQTLDVTMPAENDER